MKTLDADDDKDGDRHGDRHLALMADVVAAYVSNNSLPLNDLPALMRSVHASLVDLAGGQASPPPEEPKSPAVPIRKSITPDFLICLEDGKKFRSLKRHLGTVYKLTPEKYREKWGLPSDYPMVAPAYSAVRSQLAKAIGLGQTGRAEAEGAPAEAAPAEVARQGHQALAGSTHEAAPTHHEAAPAHGKAVPKTVAAPGPKVTGAAKVTGVEGRARERGGATGSDRAKDHPPR